jgi:hypothetical protein
MEQFWLWLAVGGIALVILKIVFRESEKDDE